MGKGISLLVIIGVLIVILVFCIKMAILTSKAQKAGKQQRNEKMKELNAKEHGAFFHVVGLPLPERVLCNVYWGDDKIVINGGGATFNLSLNKIKDIITTTSVDIQKSYTSSAGGAVAGGMLFGPLGAIVCGRSKEKETKKVSVYLVITYKKDDKLEYISFDVTNNMKAYKFVSLFKQCPRAVEEIEL